MKNIIPKPSIIRLCQIYSLLVQHAAIGKKSISSPELAEELGATATSIRKDINLLGEIGDTRAGYSIDKLKDHIGERLHLTTNRKACLVGLGRLGAAVLNYPGFSLAGYEIMAGFDASINRIETLSTTVPMYSSIDIERVIREKSIELALIAVPSSEAQGVADRLIDCGIRGIVNFAPVIITSRAKAVVIRNIDLIGELRIISALLAVGGD